MQTEEEQQENEKKAKEKRQTLFAQYELKQIVGDIKRSKLPRQLVSFLEIAEKNPFFYGTKGEKRREQLAKKFSWYKLLPIKNYLVHLQSLQVSEVSETTRAEIDAFKQCEGDVDPSIPEATKIVESSSSVSSESTEDGSVRIHRPPHKVSASNDEACELSDQFGGLSFAPPSFQPTPATKASPNRRQQGYQRTPPRQNQRTPPQNQRTPPRNQQTPGRQHSNRPPLFSPTTMDDSSSNESPVDTSNWIEIDVDLSKLERNREFEIFRLLGLRHNNHIRNAIHIRKLIAGEDRHLWSASIPHKYVDQSLWNRCILLTGPSQDHHARNNAEDYVIDMEASAQTVTLDAINGLRSDIKAAGKSRELMNYLLKFSEEIYLDNFTLANDKTYVPTEVTAIPHTFHLQGETYDSLTWYAYWTIAESGGRRVGLKSSTSRRDADIANRLASRRRAHTPAAPTPIAPTSGGDDSTVHN